MYRTSLFLFVLLAVSPSALLSQPPPAAATPAAIEPEIIRLTLTPAGFPGGALRHRLLPEYLDRTPGNAATLYYRAMVGGLETPRIDGEEFSKNWETWSQGPVAELPREEVRRYLFPFRWSLATIEEGALRESCDWGVRPRELQGTNVYEFLLPDISHARTMSRILVLRNRLEIAEGRLEDALKSIRVGLQFARDISKTPFLINSLVSVAVASSLLSNVTQFIQHEDAPNLYWSLAALPRPLVDATEAMEQERSIPLQMFSIIREANRTHTPEEWRKIFLESLAALDEARELSLRSEEVHRSIPFGAAQRELALAAFMAAGYPIAKQWLLDQGRDVKEVEAMPTAQVVAMYVAASYHFLWGEMFKNFYLPYPESLKRAKQFEQELASGDAEKRGPGKEILPIARMLLPAISAATAAQARLDREVAVLRTIEALRLHAYENEGRWPKALEEITSVPVPLNPVDSQPFKYRLDGETAVLELEPVNNNPRTARRYELTARK